MDLGLRDATAVVVGGIGQALAHGQVHRVPRVRPIDRDDKHGPAPTCPGDHGHGQIGVLVQIVDRGSD